MLRISDVKNVNKSKNRLTLIILESKKQDKKLFASREGLGGAIPSNVRKKPRHVLIENLDMKKTQDRFLAPGHFCLVGN